jgi:hypothetical protein
VEDVGEGARFAVGVVDRRLHRLDELVALAGLGGDAGEHRDLVAVTHGQEGNRDAQSGTDPLRHELGAYDTSVGRGPRTCSVAESWAQWVLAALGN